MPGPADVGIPMVQIDPAHLDLLQQRGVISPEAAAIAKAKAMGLDAKLGLPQGQGFQNMFDGGGQPPVAPAPAPAPMPEAPIVTQAKEAKAKQPKLTPEQVRQADVWQKLADAVVWVNPRTQPAGSQFNGVQARKMPTAAQKLLEEMYPDKVKAGLVPMGWGSQSTDAMPLDQKSLLAQLVLMGSKETPEAGGQ